MTISAGSRLGSYEVVSPLGSGGMGEVWHARDLKLGRHVAIKLLPEPFAADAQRLERFEREARSLASLNHPNIVTIYSVEEFGNTRFLTMELVEGETLAGMIPSDGLELTRFFDLAIPIADAISSAHEHGVVHRDLKPGNIMVSAVGQVKVLDFGLAKLGEQDSNPNFMEAPTESRKDLTGAGQVFGTVAYMSPEQARGERVDTRSDIFSMGVLFYQMLAGECPFQGASTVDLISSILRDRPPSVIDRRADLPPHLARIVRRCLEKDPRDRYQNSRDVLNELKDLRAKTLADPLARATDLWVAVLPFKVRGEDAEAESFAEGLVDEITTGLALFPYLAVIARKSTLGLAGESDDPRSVGQRLGVRYLLEGSVRKAGPAIRVSVRLTETVSGAHIWAESYNRNLASDPFAAQDEITDRVVATLADGYGVLVHSMTAALEGKADTKLTPLEWMIRFYGYRQRLSTNAHWELEGSLEAAVKRDPAHSETWACLSQIYLDEFSFKGRAEALDQALDAARKAIDLDRTNQLGFQVFAQAQFLRRDLAAFKPAAERAMALNPRDTNTLAIMGIMIAHAGDFERGAELTRHAMELNPNHADWYQFGVIWQHFHAGEYEEALESALRVNMPGLFWQPLAVAAICGHLGRRDQAAAALRDLLAIDPGFPEHSRRIIEAWHYASGLTEPLLDGLRKAGLRIPEG